MNRIKPWVLASRPKTLFATLAPIIIALSLSYQITSKINWLIASMTLLAAILLQIGSNYANDAYDFIKGADNNAFRVGPKRMSQSGTLKPDSILNMMYFIFIISVFIGYYLASIGGWPIVIIGLISILFAIIYTGGPYPLGYNGLGDITVFIFFGLIATFGTVYLQNHNSIFLSEYFYEILILATASGALNTAILVVNNIRDYKSDKLSNKKTLVVRLGQKFACYEYMFLLILNYTCYILISFLWSDFMILLIMFPIPILSLFLIKKVFDYNQNDLNIILEKTAKMSFLNALLFFIYIMI